MGRGQEGTMPQKPRKENIVSGRESSVVSKPAEKLNKMKMESTIRFDIIKIKAFF